MSNETTTEGPYTVERNVTFNEWGVVFSGLPRLTFASEKEWICIRVCEALNTAYRAGQASREQAHPQTEDLEAPPVSEPVAWMQPSGPVISGAIYRRWSGATGSENWLLAKKYTIPLYAHPTKE